MTVQPCRDWAASTESMVLVSQNLSQRPSHALQNILYRESVRERNIETETMCVTENVKDRSLYTLS